jgi:hypothetical protein
LKSGLNDILKSYVTEKSVESLRLVYDKLNVMHMQDVPISEKVNAEIYGNLFDIFLETLSRGDNAEELTMCPYNERPRVPGKVLKFGKLLRSVLFNVHKILAILHGEK